MNAHVKALLRLVTLLALLSVGQMASAYYDPGVQRWINRDPVEEHGGLNLFRFAANDPLDRVDVRGLLVAPPPTMPPVVIGPVGCAFVVGGLCACAIDAVSCILWPEPSPDPLPLPKPRPRPRLLPPPCDGGPVNAPPVVISPPDPEQCPKEVDTTTPDGNRFCVYYCRKSGIKITKYGADCDKSSIKYPPRTQGRNRCPPIRRRRPTVLELS